MIVLLTFYAIVTISDVKIQSLGPHKISSIGLNPKTLGEWRRPCLSVTDRCGDSRSGLITRLARHDLCRPNALALPVHMAHAFSFCVFFPLSCYFSMPNRLFLLSTRAIVTQMYA